MGVGEGKGEESDVPKEGERPRAGPKGEKDEYDQLNFR